MDLSEQHDLCVLTNITAIGTVLQTQYECVLCTTTSVISEAPTAAEVTTQTVVIVTVVGTLLISVMAGLTVLTIVVYKRAKEIR